MHSETPAVIVGAGINGLGVARSLVRAGVPVWLLDSNLKRPEMSTRAVHRAVVRSLRGPMLVEDLEQLAAIEFPGQLPVLFLTQEAGVETVSRERERLQGLYRFVLPVPAVVDALRHKQGFQRTAERLGAPIPPLVHVCTLGDLPALAHLGYPVVVKPGGHCAEYSRHFQKAYRVDDIQETEKLVRGILPVLPDVVVQEWIDGPDSNLYFCLQYIDRRGRMVASFTGRKIRSWPPQTGGTASCTAAPEAHARLSALTADFFAAAGVVGMAGMEYKRDGRTGVFRMVEPTIGRTDYQEEVATLNGVNIPYAAWCAELGLPIPEPRPMPHPRAWRVRIQDVQSAAAQGQRITDGFGGSRRAVDALWRWSDPVPGLTQAAQRVRRALCKRIPGQAGRSATGSKA